MNAGYIDPAELDTPVTLMLSPATQARLALYLAQLREADPTADDDSATHQIFLSGLDAALETHVQTPTPAAEITEIDTAPLGKVRHALHLPLDLHPATQDLVRNFAEALGEKLYAAQVKYGWTDDWLNADPSTLNAELVQHIKKGDTRDVAAYCAMLWKLDEPCSMVGYRPAGEVVAEIKQAWAEQKRAADRCVELESIRLDLERAVSREAESNRSLQATIAAQYERHQADQQHWRGDIQRLTTQLETARCQSVQAAITVLQAAMAHTNASLTIDQQAHAEVVYGSGLDALRVPPNELADVIESLECLAAHAEAPF